MNTNIRSTTFGPTGGGDAGTGTPAKTSEPFNLNVTTSQAVSTVPSLAPTLSTAISSAPPAPASTTATPTTTALKSAFGDTTAVQKPDQSASALYFNQLEEHINKWTLELEEQETNFTNQATQINAWDKLLILNNDKIVVLNDAAQKVKAEQDTLEQELEFIATQQAELEESIQPLQKDLVKLPQVDVERTQTYLLVENLDSQLKQMSEDLKEIIDYLNDASVVQNSSDPIVQIGKILNAHMNSLQWIESSSSAIGIKIDEILKMHESLRTDTERSFRLTYYD